MNVRILDQEQLHTFVLESTYEVLPEAMYRARCLDGYYEPSELLPAIAFPGGDLGNLASLYASAQAYGFEMDTGKTEDVLLEKIGGIQHFSCYDASNDNTIFQAIPFLSHIELENKYMESLEKIWKRACVESQNLHSYPFRPEESAIVRIKGNIALYCSNGVILLSYTFFATIER